MELPSEHWGDNSTGAGGHAGGGSGEAGAVRGRGAGHAGAAGGTRRPGGPGMPAKGTGTAADSARGATALTFCNADAPFGQSDLIRGESVSVG